MNDFEEIDQWIRDHAYGPDDIVFGTLGLSSTQLPAIHELLDIVRPGWQELFE